MVIIVHGGRPARRFFVLLAAIALMLEMATVVDAVVTSEITMIMMIRALRAVATLKLATMAGDR